MDGFGWFILGAAVAVGTGVGLGVRLVQVMVRDVRGQRIVRRVGWRAVLGWTAGFAAAAFGASAIMSIGVFVLPVAMIVCGIVAWRCRAFPEGAIGAGLGTGIVLGIIGLMNPTPHQPCVNSATLRSGEYASFACGGVNGFSWLSFALTLVGVALAGQTMLRRRNKVRGAQAHWLSGEP
jgi:hypothetical protein